MTKLYSFSMHLKLFSDQSQILVCHVGIQRGDRKSNNKYDMALDHVIMVNYAHYFFLMSRLSVVWLYCFVFWIKIKDTCLF